MIETAIEKRLIMLEKAVFDLQQKVSNKPTTENWLDNLIGSVSDESAFLKALEYGREFRHADRPVNESTEQV